MVKFVWIFVIAFLFVPSCSALQALKPLPKVKQIFVIVCDGLTLQDLERAGEPITTLMNKSAVGLLSGASAELRGRQGVFVTLGMGKRAKANERAILGTWLVRNGVSVSRDGDGILKMILGEVKPVESVRGRFLEVTFTVASKSQLPDVVRKTLSRLSREACLWLLVPNSPQTDWMHRRLTPILVFGEKVPPGLLTSSTTRQTGLVSSVDFAPTVLDQMSIPVPAEITGKVMKVETSVGDRIAFLRWLEQRSLKPLQDLPALSFTISSVTATSVLLVLFVAAFALRGRSLKPGKLIEVLTQITAFAVVAGMSIPMSLFFVTQLSYRSGIGSAPWLVAMIVLAGSIALWLSNKLNASPFPPSLRAAGLTCALSAAVALLGVPLYWATPLGHYPTTGWRYFGITNSGAGIILSGTIFAWKLLALPKWVMVPWLTVSPLLAGSSFWGSDFGGMLTLAGGFAVAWELTQNSKPSWRRAIVFGVGAMSLALLILLITESFVPADQQAHISSLLRRVEMLGISALTEIICRKLELMWEFFARTKLNFLVLALFIFLQIATASLARRSNLFAQLKPSFDSAFCGSWIGLVLNDSGIEVIGMAMVGIGGVFLLALLETLSPSIRGGESALWTGS